jgi:hypothetical protein
LANAVQETGSAASAGRERKKLRRELSIPRLYLL